LLTKQPLRDLVLLLHLDVLVPFPTSPNTYY
jgi:hypothetical protein